MPSIDYKDFTASDAQLRNLRAKHQFVFKEDSARGPSLQLALPQLGWETLPSGKLALPFGAGMRIALLAVTVDEGDAETIRALVEKPKLSSLAPGWDATILHMDLSAPMEWAEFVAQWRATYLHNRCVLRLNNSMQLNFNIWVPVPQLFN